MSFEIRSAWLVVARFVLVHRGIVLDQLRASASQELLIRDAAEKVRGFRSKPRSVAETMQINQSPLYEPARAASYHDNHWGQTW